MLSVYSAFFFFTFNSEHQLRSLVTTPTKNEVCTSIKNHVKMTFYIFSSKSSSHFLFFNFLVSELT